MDKRLQAALLALMLATNSCPGGRYGQRRQGHGHADGCSGDAPAGTGGDSAGAVITVVTLPFTLPTGSADDAAHYMIVEPAEYTFNRPLGDFDHCGKDRHHCGMSDR